jgi:hypothetical protein
MQTCEENAQYKKINGFCVRNANPQLLNNNNFSLNSIKIGKRDGMQFCVKQTNGKPEKCVQELTWEKNNGNQKTDDMTVYSNNDTKYYSDKKNIDNLYGIEINAYEENGNIIPFATRSLNFSDYWANKKY